MNDDSSLEGAACEVFPDFEAGTVVSRFIHPVTGDVMLEVHLPPAVAREYALQSTRASIELEEHEKRS
jgi:hypothetical protein